MATWLYGGMMEAKMLHPLSFQFETAKEVRSLENDKQTEKQTDTQTDKWTDMS